MRGRNLGTRRVSYQCLGIMFSWGSLPERPVTTSKSSSLSTHSVDLLTLANKAVANSRSDSETSSPAYNPDAPSPTNAGVLGMTLTIGGDRPSLVVLHSFKLFRVMPAAMQIIKGNFLRSAQAPPSSWHAVWATWGLTARTRRSALAEASMLEALVWTPRSAILLRLTSQGSET